MNNSNDCIQIMNELIVHNPANDSWSANHTSIEMHKNIDPKL